MAVLLVVVLGGVLLALLAGLGDQRAGSRMAAQRERRDPVATGSIKRQDVDTALERVNRRGRRKGRRRMDRAEFESLVVADPRTRHRLRLWKGRR